jgi:CubicO group peptidase (beta-lactamase class C family)
VRGSPVTNREVLVVGYTDGFALLRSTAVVQHAVARDRLTDMPDSVLARHRDLLGLAIDEGTALLVQGDTVKVLGRSMGFVYGYGVWRDERVPYQTLRPGDTFDINRRRPVKSARDATALTAAYADSLFGLKGGRSPRQATVLVSKNDQVLYANAYGMTLTQKLAPRTSAPTFPLRGLSPMLHAIAVQLALRDSTLTPDDTVTSRQVRVDEYLDNATPDPGAAEAITQLISTRVETDFNSFVRSRLFAPLGMKRTSVDKSGEFHSSVDELFRLEQSFRHGFPLFGVSASAATDITHTRIDGGRAWRREKYRGNDMYTIAGRGTSFRSVYVRVPALGVSVIVLSNDDGFDARDVALDLLDRAIRPPMVIPR